MRKTIKELQFKVLIEQDEDGLYVASVPELEGCYTQGKTLESVRERVKEAIKLALEDDSCIVEKKLKSKTAYPHFFAIEDMTISYA